ncbi:MAG: DegT/DnrJ/EryC1/StrS family aminotransferase [Nanoarchaeota archaeon]|nr:DegT/DnrJ/EryC1/StrS family aminotransferase [Nanoarchaeota archaeon]
MSRENIYTSKVTINDAMRKAVEAVFDSGRFIYGEKVREFEARFAKHMGSKHAIAISNGTTALEVALEAIGIGEGDEVIVTSHTAFPTIEPILRIGAVPVFGDIDPDTYTLSPFEVRKKITEKTKAVLPVHIYGHPADLIGLLDICREHSISLLEDCCQAHNAEYNGRKVGTIGVAGCFSFYPSKNMTVCGDGGMIITNSKEVAKRSRLLMNHGEDGVNNHVILGHNYRLGEIPSAIGIEQLKLLDEFTQRRREIAEIYNRCLRNAPVRLPVEREGCRHVYHLYVIQVDADKRDSIIEGMKKYNVFCGIHYPIACHQQRAMRDRGEISSLPVTEKVVREIITLPIYPLLADEDAIMIAEKIKELL